MTRLSASVKLALIVSAHTATYVLLFLYMVRTGDFKSAASVLGAQFWAAFFLVPNLLSFAISAWVMRARWVDLSVAQLVSAGFSLGVATAIIFFAFVLLFAPFKGMPVLSEILPRIMMIAPGIIGAQLLRVGMSRSAAGPTRS
jgi:hypothetical protein